jgi:hypothetical protein
MKMIRLTFAVSVTLVLATFAYPASGQTAAGDCGQLARFTLMGTQLVVAKAEVAPAAAPLPAYCRMDATIDPRTGVDGKPYGIGFAIALPDNWNGGFLFQGGGGLNGSVARPLGSQAAGDTPALARGFAVVTTDSGHKGSVFDGSFMNDQQAALDFAYVAIGRVTYVAKAVVAQYYGAPARHSYFDGCSTGGREAMLVTQRYPTYYDGVIAGDPAMRTGYSNLADAWVTVALNQIAPKDEAGKPVAGRVFSDGDKKIIVNAVLEQCDVADGLKDGMIFNSGACHFNPAALTCKGAKAEGCLTSAQVNAIQKGFAGPKNARGKLAYPGFPFDTGIAASGQGVIPGLLNPGPSPVGGPNLSLEMDVDEAAAAIAANSRTALTDTVSTDLSTFAGHGGKLIFYHGLSDPWFSPLDTLAYYERLGNVSGWSRLYLVPGMGHCQGGTATLDHFDALSAIVDWVEKGVAPDSITATGKAFPGRSRPLCAWPKYAHYKGQGNAEEARNFECRE